MNKLNTFWVLTAVMFSACIGEDIVETEERARSLEITTPVISLKIGDSLQLEFIYQDMAGAAISPEEVRWTSSEPEIVLVTEEGVLKAKKLGFATIRLTVDDLLMDSVTVEAAEMTTSVKIRSGSFSGSNGYSVSGNCELLENEGALELQFKDDFKTSNGPGLYVYMSNSESSVAGGISLGKLQKNSGLQVYAVPEGATINSYQFIIIYCQPFGVPFGNAKLN